MINLPRPCLCLVTDRNQCEGRSLEEVVDKAVDGGVNMVQLREKGLSAKDLFSLALRIRKITDGRALLIINDRVDIAIACGADGVQLGEEGLPLEAVREAFSNRLYIGRSVHTVEGAKSAEADGADFLIVGTIFPTSSHPGGEAAGVALLAKIGEHVQIPYLGIGGINTENAGSVMANGAAGVALITGITRSSSPEYAASELLRVMDKSSKPEPRKGVTRPV